MKLTKLVFEDSGNSEYHVFAEAGGLYSIFGESFQKRMLSKDDIVEFLVDHACQEDFDYPRVSAHLQKLFKDQLRLTYGSMISMLVF